MVVCWYYLSYIHIPESTWKSLRTQLKKDIVVLEISKILAMDMLDSEMVIDDDEKGCLADQGRKLGYTYHLHGFCLLTKLLNSSACFCSGCICHGD